MQHLPRNIRRNQETTPTPPPVSAKIHSHRSDAPSWLASSKPHLNALGPKALYLVPFLIVAFLVLYLVSRTLQGVPHLAVASGGPLLSPVITKLQPVDLPFARMESPAPIPIQHDGYMGLHGGVLFTPKSFLPTGSNYDLLIHFHGNTQVVRESAEVAGLNAAVAVINLGIGSGLYEQAYAVPGAYEALLKEIQWAVEQRGLPHPKLRRVALSSWSAGYGAISNILQWRQGTDPLDSILILDGIHTGFLKEQPTALNTLHLTPFVRAVKSAAAGSMLFLITHSEIDPIAYAGTTATANYLLEQAAGSPVIRQSSSEIPVHLNLESAEGAVSKKLEKRMVPTTEATLGNLVVRGYQGNTPEHHMAHLLQMGATALPELTARWKTVQTQVPNLPSNIVRNGNRP